MKKINSLLSFSIFVLSGVIAFGQSSTTQTQKPYQVKWTAVPFDHQVFIENKGQFDGQIPGNSKILFGAQLGDVWAYFTSTGVVYRYAKFPKREASKGKDPDLDVNVQPSIHYLTYNWIGCESNVYPNAADKQPNYFTYSTKDNQTIQTNVYKSITYRDIYPGIDIEYFFPKGKSGIEYSLTIHPYADLSKVLLAYAGAGAMKMNQAGDVTFPSPIDQVTDHAPQGYYADNSGNVSVSFKVNANTESFVIHNGYDNNKVLIIDPWTNDPLFGPNYDRAYDLDFDDAGNVYAYGSWQPLQLEKFDASGTPQWTYNASLFNANGYYGDIAVDRKTGRSYLTEGFGGGGARVIKINTGGAQVGAPFPGNSSLNEFWRAVYSPCDGHIILGAGGTNAPNQAAILDTNLVNVTPVNVLSENAAFHDIVLIAPDPDGKHCYMATSHSSLDNNYDNQVMQLPLPTLVPTAYLADDHYSFQESDVAHYVADGAFKANGFNGMAASSNWLYVYDGSTMKKMNKATGSIVDSVWVSNSITNFGGLDVDPCDDVFLGAYDTLKIYKPTMKLDTNMILKNTVYDVVLGNTSLVYVGGQSFVSAITVPPLAKLINTAQGSPSSCLACNGKATVTVNCGVTPFKFKWSDGSTNQTDSNLCQGVYTVVVSDGSCPPRYDSAYVNVSAEPGFKAPATDTNPACLHKGSITINPTGGHPAYTYLWNNGNTTNRDTGLVAGTYTCTITDSAGCYVKDIITLVNASTPTITVTPKSDSVCHDSTVKLTASGAKTYKWNPGNLSGSSVIVAPSNTTTYTIVGTDSNGCVGSTTCTVKVLSTPKPVITGNDSICPGGSTVLTATGGYSSYSWSSGGTTSSINVSPLVKTTYTVTVSNGICQHDTMYTVYIKPIPVPSITAKPDSICAGDSAKLTGGGGGTYAWSNPPGGTNQTVKVVAGTYTLAVTKNGCTHDTTITVVPLSNVIPTIGLTKNNICPNDSTTLHANGGTAYKWSPGGSTNSSITVDPGKTTTYTCAITTPCRIIDTTITVTYKRWPKMSISGDTSICLGNSGVIEVGGGGTYLWSNGMTTSAIIVAPTTDSTFSVQVTLNGCTRDTSINLNVHKSPHVTITPGNTICLGKDITLNAFGGCHYIWSNGATTSSITVSPGSTTTYTVKAWCFNDTIGCDTMLGSKIVVDVAQLHACCDTTIIAGDTTILTGNGSSNYVWTPNFGLSCNNCPNPVATPSVTTTYTVSSIDTLNGCTRDTVITIVVKRPCNNLYVPNVFTPNDDGINDDFVVSVDSTYPSGERSSWLNYTFYSIAIFDRWGKEVYSSFDPNQPWNGRVSNTQDLVPEGVYYYVIKSTCGSKTYELKGFVHVLDEKK